MWSMLTDIARELPWHGIKLKPDDWKLVFLDALKRETRMVPNLDGNGFVNLGRSSSDLSKSEMSDLIELIGPSAPTTASRSLTSARMPHDQFPSPSERPPATPRGDASDCLPPGGRWH
jgi:hypothetical protein